MAKSAPVKQPLSVNVAVGSAILGGSSHHNMTGYKTKPVTVQVLGSHEPKKTTPANFNVKIFNADNKKELHVFVLRDVSECTTPTPEALMKEMRRQFGSNVPKRQFQIGFMKGSLKISIRTPADMQDIWLQVSKGNDIVLWCEGVGGNASDTEEEPPKKRRKKGKTKMSALEEKNERIEEIVFRLRTKHEKRYTPIQYRLWAEMLDIGTHRSEDDPPCIPAFTPTQKSKGSSQISQLTSALTQIAGAMTPTSQSSTTSSTTAATSGISPAKMASLRSNYLQQMRDLHMLLESGAISDAEYIEQKRPILQQLKKLVPE